MPLTQAASSGTDGSVLAGTHLATSPPSIEHLMPSFAMVATQRAAPCQAAALEEERAGKWTVLGIVALGGVVATLGSSVVNIGLPTIARHFGRPLDTAVMWVVIAYLVVVASLLVPVGGPAWWWCPTCACPAAAAPGS